MRGPLSHWITIAGLLALAAWITSAGSMSALLAASPLLLLTATSLARLSYAAIAAAIVMLPYFCYGVMTSLTDPSAGISALAFTVLTIGVFLAALDEVRYLRANSARSLQH